VGVFPESPRYIVKRAEHVLDGMARERINWPLRLYTVHVPRNEVPRQQSDPQDADDGGAVDLANINNAVGQQVGQPVQRAQLMVDGARWVNIRRSAPQKILRGGPMLSLKLSA
jgi:hypothetical protein